MIPFGERGLVFNFQKYCIDTKSKIDIGVMD